MNRLLRKLTLSLVLTTLFAGCMASLAFFGISGMIDAYGSQPTPAETKTESTTDTKAENAVDTKAESPTDTEAEEITEIKEEQTTDTKASNGTEPKTTVKEEIIIKDPEIEKLMATPKGWFTVHAVRLIGCAIILVCVLLSFWLLKRIFKRYKNPTDPNLKSKSTVMMILYSVLRFLIVIIAGMIVLSIFGVNVSGMVAGLGIAGAAGALAVQDLLKDVIMGVTIVSDQYLKMGDIVDYKGYIGKVLEVSMRTTKIQGLKDKNILSLRNSNITEIAVLSHVMNIPIPFPYTLPVKEGMALLEKIAEEAAKLEPVEQAIAKGPNVFNDSSIDYLLVIYCDPSDRLNTKRAVHQVVLQVMEDAGVSIPFPQTDVYLK